MTTTETLALGAKPTDPPETKGEDRMATAEDRAELLARIAKSSNWLLLRTADRNTEMAKMVVRQKRDAGILVELEALKSRIVKGEDLTEQELLTAYRSGLVTTPDSVGTKIYWLYSSDEYVAKMFNETVEGLVGPARRAYQEERNYAEGPSQEIVDEMGVYEDALPAGYMVFEEPTTPHQWTREEIRTFVEALPASSIAAMGY